MSKFQVEDIIINYFVDPPIIRTIKHIYGGDAILNDMVTVEFYVFEDGDFSQIGDIDKYYVLSLKGRLNRL